MSKIAFVPLSVHVTQVKAVLIFFLLSDHIYFYQLLFLYSQLIRYCYVSACRDAVSDLALHFLNKMKILVVRDIERDEIEFICKVQQRKSVLYYHNASLVPPPPWRPYMGCVVASF